MMTTEKHILDSQQVAPPLPDNIGISQPVNVNEYLSQALANI